MKFEPKKDTLVELDKKNKETCNGYFILVDIVDSTNRKNDYKNKWTIQTKAFYETFINFVNELENSLEDLEVVTTKFAGDGGFTFLKSSDSANISKNSCAPADKSIKLLNMFSTYLDEIKEECLNKLGGMKLKAVITYLTDIYIIEYDDNKKDVLGRGIDFSFRLEKYASSAFIVTNDMFKKSIELSNCNEKFVKCERRIKSWEIETFWLITTDIILEDEITGIKTSPYDDNVYLELLKHCIMQKSKTDQDKDKNEQKDNDNYNNFVEVWQ